MSIESITIEAPAAEPAAPRVETPLADAAAAFLAEGVAHFATPGHKRNPALVGDDPVLLNDALLAWGADDTRFSRGVLAQAQQLAARAWGADWARFSVHGSSHPNQAICLGLASPGARVVVARTAHRSVHAGLVLAGLDPVWVSPDVDEHGFARAVPAARIERALAQAPEARAILLVEPSYLGVVSQIEAIAAIAHAHEIPLVCDQAWGAHFGFHPSLPDCALRRGADLAVTSAHKTLASFSQAALLLARDRGYVDVERLDASFEALLTTSASGAIYATIDRARAMMERDGEDLLRRALGLAQRFRDEIDGYRDARCINAKMLTDSAVSAWDPLKLVVDLGESGADGLRVEADMRAEGVVVEMADRRTILPLLTIGDDERSVGRLLRALQRALDRRAGTARRAPTCTSWLVTPVPVLSPRAAFFAPRERVAADRAVGRVAAEIVTPFPPGIPALAPGEQVTKPLLRALQEDARAGTRMAGASDATLETLLVVASR